MEEWVNKILADPITKLPKKIIKFKKKEFFLDARVYLKNTFGWNQWQVGQRFYENWLENGEISVLNKETDFERTKILEKPIYDELNLKGKILDVGGGVGTLREFLKPSDKYLCVDPHYKSLKHIPPKKIKAYKCLNQNLNYIIGFAEFLPLKDTSFDFVHMRSMLDHVQIPDLVVLEAHRVLKSKGRLIIGLTVDGGKSGKNDFKEYLKSFLRESLYLIGMKSFKDYHTWHPSFSNLSKIIEDNGFLIEKTIWQPEMNNKVVYIQACKSRDN